MTNSEKAQRTFKVLAILRDEFAQEGKTAWAATISAALKRETDGGLSVICAARLYDLLQA